MVGEISGEMNMIRFNTTEIYYQAGLLTGFYVAGFYAGLVINLDDIDMQHISYAKECLPPDSYDLFGYAIRYAVDQLNWDSFHMVSHSMGTYVAAPVRITLLSYPLI